MTDLTKVTVVVTRPAHQADTLCALIERKGGTAVRFPVMDIAGPDDSAALDKIIRQLPGFDIAMFISPNAVDYGMKVINEHGGFPSTLKVAAVGRGSARKLAEWGRPADIFPPQRFNSEALLELADLQEVQGKRIVIFRGEGGRELLATTLRQRGATVEYAQCYKRIKPDTPVEILQQYWANNGPDMFIVTSNEGLQNLYDLVGENHRENLLGTALVVVSERAVEFARQLGFHADIIVAATASDQSLVDAAELWKVRQS